MNKLKKGRGGCTTLLNEKFCGHPKTPSVYLFTASSIFDEK
jgi:hypothetical protein